MSEKKKKFTKEEKESIISRKTASLNNFFYSEQRLDLLIITISGAGIYVCLEAMKFMKENSPCSSTAILKIAGILLMGAIIVNFLSQIFGKLTNQYDHLMCDIIENDEEKANEYDEKSEKFDFFVTVTNWISYSFMFLGLIALTTYFIIYL